jgi:recombination protein RecA
MGIDYKKMWQPEKIPNSIEEVFSVIERVTTMARTRMKDKKKPVVIVWDSVAATCGSGENETDYDQSAGMALEARAMSRGLRKVLPALNLGFVTLICINQLREKIGVSFGDPNITPHGKSLPFYASVRIKLKSKKQIKDTKTERTIGVSTDAQVFKNKVGPNWRSASFPLFYDWGVNDEISLLDFCVDAGIVDGTTWKSFTYNGQEHKFQGTAKWVELLKNPEILNFVREKVQEIMVIKHDRKPDSIEIDTESLMEVEQLKSDIEAE